MAVRGSRGARKASPNTDTRNASAPSTSTRNVPLEDETNRNEATLENENRAAASTTANETADQRAPANEAPEQRPQTQDSPASERVGQRHQPEAEHVAVAAYYLAERRGFTGDQQVDDWLAAERSLAAEYEGIGDNEAAARGAVEEDIQPDEVEDWARTLNVTPERLRVAIQRVGPVSSEVRKFLQDSAGK